MAPINFRQLIDLAIGSPEPGHVNFHALHCLLYSLADEMNIIDKNVDCGKYSNINVSLIQAEEADAEAAPPAPAAESEEKTESEAKKPEPKSETATKTESKTDADAKRTSGALKQSIDQIEGRFSNIELDVKTINKAGQEFTRGIAIMKEQLDLTMDQLQSLTAMTLNDIGNDIRPFSKKMDKLRSKSNRLNLIQHENIFIESLHIAGDDVSTSWRLEEEEEEVEGEEEESQSLSQSSHKSPPPIAVNQVADEQYELDLHLCYSPEKLLDQLLELKSEFCILNNKVNEISASILEQDCQRTTMILEDLQDQMRESKNLTESLKNVVSQMEDRQVLSGNSIENILKSIQELYEDKIDKGEIDVMLANKVDYKQLQRKVSHEQIQEIKCQLERQFCEIHNLMNLNEQNMQHLIEDLRTSLGYDSIDTILKKFKDKIESDLVALSETLQKYINSTNDDCAAAGARIKVLQDLACLSCDTTCVMRTIEKAKVGKLPDAHASNLLSPLITYELGSIRKSGIMGYYRKDEFPHATNAWTNNQMGMKACVPRHAGGQHTTSTAKERFEKVLLNKK